jgi:4-aminobutyrate aminotransferase-like enzyme/Ser/Thr protein kinase RdoA (MazF antagonist)
MIDLPAFDVPDEVAERLLRDRYALTGRVTALGSQQDANFALTTQAGQRYVLKVANPGTAAEELELQHEAMRHVAAQRSVEVPRVVAGLDGAELQCVNVAGTSTHARVVTFLPGEPVMDSRYLAPSVVAGLGHLAAKVVASLKAFEHPAAERSLQWDLTRAGEVVDRLAPFVADPSRRRRVQDVTERAQALLEPVTSALPRQVIHADVTDNNVVFEPAPSGRLVPTGVIDFGDVMHSWRVAELAVLCASLLHHRGASPASVLPAVRAFHAEQPLSRDEATALWPLVLLRAAALVVSGQQQATINPANAYATAALPGEWQILMIADSVPTEVMEAAVLDATGHALRWPSPQGDLLLPGLVEGGEPAVVDLSFANGALHPGGWLDPGAERGLAEAPLRAGSAASVTRHGEHRITRARRDRSEPTPTLALGVELRTRAPQRVVAPWPGLLQRTADGVLLSGDGPSLVLSGLAPTDHDGAVATGEALGTTNEEPLWVQLSWAGADVPRFVAPELGASWLAVCPDPSVLLTRSASLPAAPTPAVEGAPLVERRAGSLATVQEHYFTDPPQIEVGWRQHLLDVEAQSYVDMLNNVTVLGHGHPRLADAVHAQWQRLNTNSRFHYASVVELSERLTQLLPRELDTVFLVNSGSEANDLALRLVWAATGRRDVVSVREAYHGWTDAVDAISTSAADNPGALDSRPDWVHTVAAPNAYRGVHRGAQAHRYAEDAVARIHELAASGRPPAAFICEPFYGNAGGMALPDGYLQSVYAAVREAGGLCIADEVQVGYGRLGAWFWGFEQQGVVPDVVTMAKGMGNGHPLGAVVTTRAIAERYRTQGYFFSSAGGSPVSSVVGLTVLDVMRDEGLQENAERVGLHLSTRLRELAGRHPLIGAVHGAGLYLGVELVRDRATLEPATEETAAICERLRELGVIVQPTSDRMCVLKIKPPMCLTRASADRFVDALDETLTHGW